MLLLASFAFAADTVSLRYDPKAVGAHAVECVDERVRTSPAGESRRVLKTRTTPKVERVGRSWAVGVERAEVLAIEPAPAGFPMESLMTRLAPLFPRVLTDRRGRWRGVEEVDAEARLALVRQAFVEGGVPPALLVQLEPTFAQMLSPEAVAAQMKVGWYTEVGRWLDADFTLGETRTEIAGPDHVLAEGTRISWGAARRLPCVDGGPDVCVELALAMEPPETTRLAQARLAIGPLLVAMGKDPEAFAYESARNVSTWSLVVDPEGMRTFRSVQRREVDMVARLEGESVTMASVETRSCGSVPSSGAPGGDPG